MSALWNDIDLNRHGVIEAHAGTGKTYTIVQLVLRMLGQRNYHTGTPAHIRDILVVTYTEKAAGELRKRIREGLDGTIASLPQNDPLRHHFENCLNNLHEAYIGTIHAICLRLLQTWPFESGIHFDTTIVDDVKGLRTMLRESMRTDWQDSSTGIPWALEHFVETGEQIGEKHYTLICDTALELLNGDHTHLDRSISDGLTCNDFIHRFAALRKQEANFFPEFDTHLQKVISTLIALGTSESIDATKSVLIKKRTSELQCMREDRRFKLTVLRDLIKSGRSKLVTKAQTAKLPLAAQLEEYSRTIADHPYTDLLAEKQQYQMQLLFSFIADCSELLAARWQESKNSNGYIAYQDMLQRMNTALRRSPEFTTALRAKIRYTIIDEFQDTSRIQWELFHRLVFGGNDAPSPRLYLVGDPKQSIYAFQGADVKSYIDARNEIRGSGNPVYRLTSNYRSTESLIHGYNLIFTSDNRNEDWFLFSDSDKGITYASSEAVTTPARPTEPLRKCSVPPVQILPLAGSPDERKFQMAKTTCDAINALIGTRISLPDGLQWNNEFVINHGDIAVIVEKHDLAVPFLNMFLENGIPAVKYKMKGVFQSSMARALHALLQAILHPFGDPAPRLAALLTPFFNRAPESIDPDHALEPCANESCHGDDLCIGHALGEWSDLANRGFWSQLFMRIQQRTGIAGRLIRLSDGERHLADLKQVIDYCIEQLYCSTMTLMHLTEHLADLLDENDSAADDKNLHVLATEKSSVKLLTMHAAKGLEFPVVFVVTDKSPTTPRSPLHWTDDNGIRTILPALSNSNDARKQNPDLDSANSRSLYQLRQERRRLLYVALTRAQALLFVPMHLKELPADPDETTDWSDYFPKHSFDNDLTTRLGQLLDNKNNHAHVTLFNLARFTSMLHKTSPIADTPDIQRPECSDEPSVKSLHLFSRISRQTSYSHLTREVATAREIDHSEEPDDETPEISPVQSPLPGGRATGDALHCALEEILLSNDSAALISDDDALTEMIENYFERNAIVTDDISRPPASEKTGTAAITAAANCLRGALLSTISLSGGYTQSLASLPSRDRIPEMEFLLKIERHWVHGYIDLVFRIPNETNASHPFRYFMIDWKSDTLPSYDSATIAHAIHQRHYDLQAKLYSHALHTYLQGILGQDYSPVDHLGGAVYLFMREHESSPRKTSTVWSHQASVEQDRLFVRKIVTTGSV